MNEPVDIKGFALLCDNGGIVKSVLRDDFGIAINNPVGKLFSNLIDPDYRTQSLNFLLEIKQKKISIDYRLNFLINDTTHNFYFIGAALYDEVLIVAANNHKEAVDFTNHLQQINNEQANLIMDLLKKNIQANYTTEKETQQLYDEITKLNNDLVNLQRQLTRKIMELERLNELKNRFLRMAAHDLRNPLGVIMNFSEFLHEELKGEISDQHLTFLQNILNSSEFMLSLVEDLLDYSKIESGNIQLKFEEFDLVKQLQSIIENSNTISKRKQIEVKLNSDVDAVMIKADIHKILQIFHNLVDNAIKFSPEKSRIKVHLEEKNETVLVKVRDQGEGIKKEDQDKVFIPFTSITKKGTAGEKGTGLGMSIVKRIVDSHNGKIWLESESGKGTTFFVELPK